MKINILFGILFTALVILSGCSSKNIAAPKITQNQSSFQFPIILDYDGSLENDSVVFKRLAKRIVENSIYNTYEDKKKNSIGVYIEVDTNDVLTNNSVTVRYRSYMDHNKSSYAVVKIPVFIRNLKRTRAVYADFYPYEKTHTLYMFYNGHLIAIDIHDLIVNRNYSMSSLKQPYFSFNDVVNIKKDMNNLYDFYTPTRFLKIF